MVAARVKAHCEAHDDVMEHQATTLALALVSLSPYSYSPYIPTLSYP